MRDTPRKVRNLLGTLACLMLMLHIVLALVIIVWPDASRHSRVLVFYRRFVVLGPFFQESRIGSTNHLLVSQYEKGWWSPGIDFSCLAVASHKGGKYESLQRHSFETFLADRAARRKRNDARVPAVKELEDYVRLYAPFANIDSIAVAYIRRSGVGNLVQTDTLYQHKFKP